MSIQTNFHQQQQPIQVSNPEAHVVAASDKKQRRGKRGGKEMKRRKDGLDPKKIASSSTDEVQYNLTPEQKLDAAIEKLELEISMKSDYQESEQSERIQNLKGKRKTIVTTDWSNFHLFESVIATYDVVHSEVPNAHKSLDIVEALAYCQMVIDGRLACQGDVLDTFRVYDVMSQEPGYLLDAGLTPIIVMFMEMLAPRFTSDGVLILHAPYEYEQVIGHQVLQMTRQYVMPDAAGTQIGPARNYDVLRNQYDHNVSIGQIRLNVFDLIHYRNQRIQGNHRNLQAADMNRIVGFDLFTHNYQINPMRTLYCVQARMRQGTFLHEFIDMRFSFRRLCYGKFRMITNFNKRTWQPRIETQMVIHYICGNGDVRITRAPDKYSVLFSPNVMFNGLLYRDSARRAAETVGRIPATSFVKKAVTTVEQRSIALVHGLKEKKLYDYIVEWKEQAGRTDI